MVAVAMAMSGGAALAHDPEELGGTPLSSPFGQGFWFFANFQTAQNPFNAANTHVTSSDIAFWGDLAYVGDYGGFRIFDISQSTPELVADERCYGPQGDPSVFDRDGDGSADTLVLSVDSVLAGPLCGAAPVAKDATTGRYPDGGLGGPADLRRVEPRRPAPDRDRVPGLRIAHEHAAPGSRWRVDVRAQLELPARRGPDLRAARRRPGPQGQPRRRPGRRGAVQRPGGRDGADVPGKALRSWQPRKSSKGIVGAACGEQAQVWNIDPATGLPNTAKPRWAYDQPNVDFWHSATFSWDGKVANFIDESFGDGCPPVTTKTAGMPGDPKVFETGNMFLFDAKGGELLSEFRNPRPTNDDVSPTTGKYCSSHLGIPLPSRDRYLLVNAYYRGGSAVIDFSDPTAPKEIAFADLNGTNTWSAYTYPRTTRTGSIIPVYSNDGLSRNYGTAAEPRYPETAYGFMRFRADVGPTSIVGLDHLNPQRRERVIAMNVAQSRSPRGKPTTYAEGTPAPAGARNVSARPFEK